MGEYSNSPENDPVVICGMAMRLPGGVTTGSSFWDLMVSKRCASVPIHASRFNHAGYYSSEKRTGTLQLRQAYLLEGGADPLERFETCHFPFSRKEVEAMDPAQRNLLEVTWEALENAGETGWQGKDVGCYVGSYIEEWSTEMTRDPMHYTSYPAGMFDIMLANRLSYAFDFRGPSMTVRTGCSASLVSLHLAERAILQGECSAAIVAGCNLCVSGVMATKASYEALGNVFSPEGICRTFDAAADGYGRGEAINAVYLKRLSAALRDGNPIRAVIRATATQHDGKSSGLLNPNTHAQEALIRHTYRVAGIHDFGETAFFECHGTGTVTGDPTEVSAVTRVFGEKGVLIGGVKPNVGHSEGAAALTSIIKVALMLERGVIAPTANFSKPSPNIPWADGRIKVTTEAQPFPSDRLKRVSVNSFGIGGSNAHAILEAWEPEHESTKTISPSADASHLLLLSASSAKSLELQQEGITRYITEKQPNLVDLAHTLGSRRTKLSFRTFMIAGNGSDLPQSSRGIEASPNKQRSVVFVFNGQGAQWPQMGSALIKANPVFAQCIRRLDRALSKLPLPPSWKIEDELLKDASESRVMSSDVAVPCSTAVQIGLVEVLGSWSVRPGAVAGHSSGEIAAAVAAGALTSEEAIVVAYYRGYIPRSMQKAAGAKPEGAMAAVGLGSEEVSKYLVPDKVVVACENSHASTTISGDKSVVEAIVERAKADGVSATLLTVDMAYHSPHMSAYGQSYEDAIRPFIKSTTAPHVPFYSSVTGQLLEGSMSLGAAYWHQSLVQPVRFNEALRRLLSGPVCSSSPPVLIEIGARPALRGPIRQILDSLHSGLPGASYVPTLEKESDCATSLLKAAGALFCENVDNDMTAITPPGRTLSDLPPYPWAHEDVFRRENRLYKAARDNKFPMHDLLGRQIFEGNALEPTWRKVLLVEELPWLGEHVISGQVVFPFAAYVSVAEEALRQVSGGVLDAFAARNFEVFSALQLEPGSPVELHTRLRRLAGEGEDAWDVKITAWKNDVWTEHCHAVVSARPFPSQAVGVNIIERRTFPRALPKNKWYKTVEELGCYYGPSFRGLDSITASPTTQEATARLQPLATDPTDYLIHPTAIDQGFQLLTIATFHALQRRAQYVFMPRSVEEIFIRRSAVSSGAPFWATVTGSSAARKDMAGDVLSYTDDGHEVMSMRGIKGNTIAALTAKDDVPLFSTLSWKPHAAFHGFYQASSKAQQQSDFLAQALDVLTHTNPQMNVLEIGSGEDVTTRELLALLRPEKGQQLFARYAYATLSSETAAQATEALGDLEGLLDIGTFRPELGAPALKLEPGSFDVIVISSKLLRSVADGQGSLTDLVEHLRRPAGRMIMLKSPEGDQPVLTQSLLSALCNADLDPSTPGAELLLSGGPTTFQSSVSSVYQSICIITEPQQPQSGLVGQFKSELAARSIAVQTRTMGQQVPAENTLVFFLDLYAPYVHNLTEADFAPFMQLLSNHKPPMVWVTTSDDPRTAMIYGLARTLRSELKADLTVVELGGTDGFGIGSASSLARIVQGLPHRRINDHAVGPDYEFAIVGDEIQVPRYQWTTPHQELSRCARQRAREACARLVPKKPRQVDSLRWLSYPMDDLRPGQIRVEVKASAVNQGDVDAVESTVNTSSLQLGQEGSGVVTQVGSNVKGNIQVGDRVMFLSKGAVASHLDMAPARCLRLGDSATSFEVAATLPLAVVTAYLAVVVLGRISKDAIVVLPFVRSNVCVALVRILQRREAKIYLTVNSDDDRGLLNSLAASYDMPKHCILSGNDDQLVTQFHNVAGGSRADYAIDLGDRLPKAAVDLLSPMGMFLDVTDVAEPGKIHGSQAYRTVDVGSLDGEVELLDRVFEECNAFLSSSSIQLGWLPPAKVCESSACSEAFQASAGQPASGANKCVLRTPVKDERTEIPMSHTNTGLRFRADAAYLLVGGLGGLGRAVSTWMVENGARQLIYLSRSAAEGPTTTPFFDELRSQGCVVTTVAGSVNCREDVERAVGAAVGPVAGVLQMSMVLRDNALGRMTYQEWKECVDPKVAGTINLHDLLLSRNESPDFFLLFSSISGVMGQIGQANYNAANTFLDAFVRHRHRLGLPASAIDIGVMGSIGVVAESGNMEAMARAAGYHVLGEQDLMDAITASILAPVPKVDDGKHKGSATTTQLVLGMWSNKPLADPSTHVVWKREARMSFAHTLTRWKRSTTASDSESDDEGTAAIVGMARTAPECLHEDATVQLICKAMGRAIADLFVVDVGGEILPTVLLDDLGVDSMNAVELQAWIAQHLHVDFPMFDLMHTETMWDLAARVAELMYEDLTQES